MFFDEEGVPLYGKTQKEKSDNTISPGTRTLSSALECDDNDFVDFLARCLTWDPEQRILPGDALKHRWIDKAEPSSGSAEPSLYYATQSKRKPEIPGGALPDRIGRLRKSRNPAVAAATKVGGNLTIDHSHNNKPAPNQPAATQNVSRELTDRLGQIRLKLKELSKKKSAEACYATAQRLFNRTLASRNVPAQTEAAPAGKLKYSQL